jgi:hypothetical protein
MVSRVLKELESGGYLEFSREGVVLHRPLPESW